MSPFKCCVVLAAVLAAGCAAAPEQAADRSAAPASAQGDAQAAQASRQGDDAQASAQDPEAIQTIALTQRDADPGAVVICRDMLQAASNVIVTRCMTRADWDTFERAQSRRAQQFLRRLRGESAY